MDRLVEHVVAWHNSHPLAKKITIYDVHTVGVVALPFLRPGGASAAVAPGGAATKVAEPVEALEPIEPIEPIAPIEATEAVEAVEATEPVEPAEPTEPVEPVEPIEAARAEDDEAATHDLSESTQETQAAPTAQHQQPPPGAEDPPEQPLPKPGWRERLSGLAKFWQRGGAASSSIAWPAFSERFIPGLRPARIAKFAQSQGFQKPPGDATWPQRVVTIDEAMMAKRSGAWPFELYLISAAIDAGNSRSRVLIGMGRKPHILGPRCWSRLRLGLAAMVLLSLLGLSSALLLQQRHAKQGAEAATTAASAASAAAAAAASAAHAASAAAAAAIAQAEAATAAAVAEAASSSASGAAGSEPAASGALSDTLPPMPTATPAAEAASEPPADIRPNFVKPMPKRTPFAAKPEESEVPAKPDAKEDGKAESKSADKAADKPSDRPSTSTPLVEKLGPLGNKADGGKSNKQDNRPVVALVGPVSPSKPEAEATLARMREMIAPMHEGALQAQLVQIPGGWRAAVWPFDSREEAQLINATLVARGMRTKAVDF